MSSQSDDAASSSTAGHTGPHQRQRSDGRRHRGRRPGRHGSRRSAPDNEGLDPRPNGWRWTVTPASSDSPGANSSLHVAADVAQVVNTSTSHCFMATRCSQSIRSQCSVPPTTRPRSGGRPGPSFMEPRIRDDLRGGDDGQQGVGQTIEGMVPGEGHACLGQRMTFARAVEQGAEPFGHGRRDRPTARGPRSRGPYSAAVARLVTTGTPAARHFEHRRRRLAAADSRSWTAKCRPVRATPASPVRRRRPVTVTRSETPLARARSPMTWARIGGQGPTKATGHPAWAAASTRRSGRLAIDTTPKATTTGSCPPRPGTAPDPLPADRVTGETGGQAGRQHVDGRVMGKGSEIELQEPSRHLGVDEESPTALGHKGHEADAGGDEIEDGTAGSGAPRRPGPFPDTTLHPPRQLAGEASSSSPASAVTATAGRRTSWSHSHPGYRRASSMVGR